MSGSALILWQHGLIRGLSIFSSSFFEQLHNCLRSHSEEEQQQQGSDRLELQGERKWQQLVVGDGRKYSCQTAVRSAVTGYIYIPSIECELRCIGKDDNIKTWEDDEEKDVQWCRGGEGWKHTPAKHFATLEPQNRSIDVYEHHKLRRPTDFEPLKQCIFFGQTMFHDTHVSNVEGCFYLDIQCLSTASHFFVRSINEWFIVGGFWCNMYWHLKYKKPSMVIWLSLGFPAEPFTILEPHSRRASKSVDRRATAFKATKLWKASSGYPSTDMLELRKIHRWTGFEAQKLLSLLFLLSLENPRAFLCPIAARAAFTHFFSGGL